MAQWPSYPTPNVPKTPDGKPDLRGPTPRTAEGHPDLSGIWMVDMPRRRGNRAAGGTAAAATPGKSPAP
ncbi:MAG TPA: hypothetical protein VFY39_11695, partial [Gammaproteobacteria bacterium]|nr:hypothetical protein [Gammaproteobacteria bacterium]